MPRLVGRFLASTLPDPRKQDVTRDCGRNAVGYQIHQRSPGNLRLVLREHHAECHAEEDQPDLLDVHFSFPGGASGLLEKVADGVGNDLLVRLADRFPVGGVERFEKLLPFCLVAQAPLQDLRFLFSARGIEGDVELANDRTQQFFRIDARFAGD